MSNNCESQGLVKYVIIVVAKCITSIYVYVHTETKIEKDINAGMLTLWVNTDSLGPKNSSKKQNPCTNV